MTAWLVTSPSNRNAPVACSGPPSFVSQCDHWINAGGAARGNTSGENRHNGNHKRDNPEGQRIVRGNTKEKAADQPASEKSRKNASEKTTNDGSKAQHYR